MCVVVESLESILGLVELVQVRMRLEGPWSFKLKLSSTSQSHNFQEVQGAPAHCEEGGLTLLGPGARTQFKILV